MLIHYSRYANQLVHFTSYTQQPQLMLLKLRESLAKGLVFIFIYCCSVFLNMYIISLLLQLRRCQQMVEQLQMDKETLNQQCHDLQQELLLEGDKQQELQEQIKRLKDEIKHRLACFPRYKAHIYILSGSLYSCS